MRTPEYVDYIPWKNISTWQENVSITSLMKRTNDPKVFFIESNKKQIDEREFYS